MGKRTKFRNAWCFDCTEGISANTISEQMAWWLWHLNQGHDGYCEMSAK